MGVLLEQPKSGSHWMCRRADGAVRGYPIPAHNGLKTEIDDKYIRGLCRHFGLSEAELRKML